MTCAVDESRSTTLDGQTDDIKTHRLDINDLASTMSGSCTEADFNVEHHQDDEARTLIREDTQEVDRGNADDAGDDGGDRSSTCSSPSDELQQNQKHRPTDGDHVNEDDMKLNGGGIEEQADDDGSCVLATGLAALIDGSLVIADYGAGCVRLCDAEGHTEHRIIGLKPFSVATTSTSLDINDQLIYVGDRRRKTLIVLDRHGSDVAQWPDGRFDWICGIACLPDRGHLAVLDRSRTRQLCVYPTGGEDGRALAELGGQGTSLSDLCMAEFVATDSLGRVLVADSGNHCVKAFDHRVPWPGVVAVYGTTRGSGDAQLEWPKGVAVDSADNVLVADCRNGRVVSFSADGRSLGSLVPTVRGPFAVCTLATSLDRRRRLAVTTHAIGAISQLHFYDYDTDAIFV